MAQVDQDPGTGIVRDPGQRRDVGEVAGPVRDVADHHEGGVTTDHRRQVVDAHAAVGIGLDPAHAQPALGGDPLDDVPVGREVVAVHDDLTPAGPGGDRGAHHLVEQHRGRVPDGDLARCGAGHHLPDPVAERQRQVEPPLVPAPDQPGPPLLLDEGAHPLRRRAQWATERVPVEVDDRAVRADEAVPQPGQGVAGVERGGIEGHPVNLGEF